MVAIDLYVPRDQIAYVRFILEAYEGLAIQTSLPRSTQVTWHIPQSRLGEARQLLTVLSKEAGLALWDTVRRDPEPRQEGQQGSDISNSDPGLKETSHG